MEASSSSSSAPSSADPFHVLWPDIEHGVREVHESKHVGRMRFIELYSKIYNYCLSRPQANIHVETAPGDGHGKTRLNVWPDGDTSRPAGSVYFVGKRLYDQLEILLTEILTKKLDVLKSESGFEFLRGYNHAWEAFKTNSQSVNRIFSYLNRHWIHHGPGENREPSKPFQIYQLALDVWKSVVYDGLKDSLLREILSEYEKDRLGVSNEDKLILKQIVESYITLGMTSTTQVADPHHPDAHTLDPFTNLVIDPQFYMDELEEHLLVATNEYFTKLAKNYISCNPGKVAEYMKMAKYEILGEEERARQYFPTQSFSKLMKVVDDALIRDHLEEIRGSFPGFLEKEAHKDLARTFTLVFRLGDELPPFCQLFTEHATAEGVATVLQAFEEHRNKGPMEPKVYFETLLGVHDKFKKVVTEEFKGNTAFQSALDIACAAFVNTNAVTAAAAGNSQKSAEILAKYADTVLRKSTHNVAVEEKTLDDIIQIFQFLLDKDAFQTYYSIRLASRLINQNSVSDESESLMIEKLKTHSGFEYTGKFMKMYKDIVVSKDLHTEFKEYSMRKEAPLTFDFHPFILTSGSWPFKYINSDFTLPQELEVPVNTFVQFYMLKHPGRKLIWLQNRSKGELQDNCFPERHIFQLSMYQMAVLLMYNTASRYSFQEILEGTGLPQDLCTNVLETLTSSKLLMRENQADKGEISNDTGFQLNLEYKNNRYRVTLPNTLTFEHKADNEKSEHTIKEGRKFILQACIVRVMKTHQTLGHRELELEVMEKTRKQFHPDSALIKKCIELLIQKEYLKRSEESNDTYVYIS